MYIDPMAIVAGITYFLGIFLYYWHCLTVLYLTDNKEYDGLKVLLVSLIWPFYTLQIIWDSVIMAGDEDEDEK